MVNKYYYIQCRGVTLKSNHLRSLKMGPIDRSYSRACITITSSGVCFVSKQLASTSFRRQVLILLSTLLVQRWRGSSGNVRLSNLPIEVKSPCCVYRFICGIWHCGPRHSACSFADVVWCPWNGSVVALVISAWPYTVRQCLWKVIRPHVLVTIFGEARYRHQNVTVLLVSNVSVT